MLNLIIFISYYKIELRKNSPGFFKSFQFLEYGFKANAGYNFNISNPTTEMVFGLATKKELQNILLMNNNPQYCRNKDRLSKIQYFIINDTIINGKTTNKNILTPYIFTCNEVSTFTLSLDYINANHHSDYRCEYSIIFDFFFSITFFVIFVGFKTFFSCFNKSDDKAHSLLADIIFIFYLQDFIFFIFFIDSYNNEYFFSKSGEKPLGHLTTTIFIILKIIILIIMITNLFCFVVIMLIQSRTNILTHNSYLIIQGILLIIMFSFFFIELRWISYFAVILLNLVVIILTFIIQSPFSLTKLSAIVNFIGNFFTFPIGYVLIKETFGSLSTHAVVLWLNSITLITQIISTVLLLIGFFVYHDIKVITIEQEDSYSFNMLQET